MDRKAIHRTGLYRQTVSALPTYNILSKEMQWMKMKKQSDNCMGAKSAADTVRRDFFVLFPIAITDIIWYSVATLSSIIVIYRQVMPNHRKTGTFDGRKSQNHDIMGNPKKRKFIEFW